MRRMFMDVGMAGGASQRGQAGTTQPPATMRAVRVLSMSANAEIQPRHWALADGLAHAIEEPERCLVAQVLADQDAFVVTSAKTSALVEELQRRGWVLEWCTGSDPLAGQLELEGPEVELPSGTESPLVRAALAGLDDG